jgi:hypothetical protein
MVFLKKQKKIVFFLFKPGFYWFKPGFFWLEPGFSGLNQVFGFFLKNKK